MSRPSLTSFLHLLEQRMLEQPAPSLEELQGIKELVQDHLSHPALAALSPESQTSTTTSSSTSASPRMTELPSDAPLADPNLTAES